MESKNDVGIVTPRGIWFDGKIYSCSLAVRQQWFKLAEHIGGWPVSVQYQEVYTDQIHVLLQDGTAVILKKYTTGSYKGIDFKQLDPEDQELFADNNINEVLVPHLKS